MVNKRNKMLRSNQRAITFLLRQGFRFIWLNPHTRYGSITYFLDGTKLNSKDIAGLFDGFAVKDGRTFYLQIKTNAFPPLLDYRRFCEENKVDAILINIPDREPVECKTIYGGE